MLLNGCVYVYILLIINTRDALKVTIPQGSEFNSIRFKSSDKATEKNKVGFGQAQPHGHNQFINKWKNRIHAKNDQRTAHGGNDVIISNSFSMPTNSIKYSRPVILGTSPLFSMKSAHRQKNRYAKLHNRNSQHAKPNIRPTNQRHGGVHFNSMPSDHPLSAKNERNDLSSARQYLESGNFLPKELSSDSYDMLRNTLSSYPIPISDYSHNDLKIDVMTFPKNKQDNKEQSSRKQDNILGNDLLTAPMAKEDIPIVPTVLGRSTRGIRTESERQSTPSPISSTTIIGLSGNTKSLTHTDKRHSPTRDKSNTVYLVESTQSLSSVIEPITQELNTTQPYSNLTEQISVIHSPSNIRANKGTEISDKKAMIHEEKVKHVFVNAVHLVEEAGNSILKAENSDVKEGKSVMKEEHSVIKMGSSEMKLGNSVMKVGSSEMKAGNSVIKVGNSEMKAGNSVKNTGNPIKEAEMVENPVEEVEIYFFDLASSIPKKIFMPTKQFNPKKIIHKSSNSTGGLVGFLSRGLFVHKQNEQNEQNKDYSGSTNFTLRHPRLYPDMDPAGVHTNKTNTTPIHIVKNGENAGTRGSMITNPINRKGSRKHPNNTFQQSNQYRALNNLSRQYFERHPKDNNANPDDFNQRRKIYWRRRQQVNNSLHHPMPYRSQSSDNNRSLNIRKSYIPPQTMQRDLDTRTSNMKHRYRPMTSTNYDVQNINKYWSISPSNYKAQNITQYRSISPSHYKAQNKRQYRLISPIHYKAQNIGHRSKTPSPYNTHNIRNMKHHFIEQYPGLLKEYDSFKVKTRGLENHPTLSRTDSQGAISKLKRLDQGLKQLISHIMTRNGINIRDVDGQKLAELKKTLYQHLQITESGQSKTLASDLSKHEPSFKDFVKEKRVPLLFVERAKLFRSGNSNPEVIVEVQKIYQ